MIDQYGCDENDFICKINAKQALANQPTETLYDNNVGGGPRETYRHTPLTQEQKDANLGDAINQNQLARNSFFGQSPQQMQGNLMGLPVGMPLGTIAKNLGNTIQGINPSDTTQTYDWYQGDTNSQGNPTGPTGSFERGLQGTYGSQYEKDIASMYGDGSDEHMNAISEQFGDDSKVSGGGLFSGGLFSGGMGAGGLLAAASSTGGSDSSSANGYGGYGDDLGGGYSDWGRGNEGEAEAQSYNSSGSKSTGDMTGGDFQLPPQAWKWIEDFTRKALADAAGPTDLLGGGL